ncbi:MAG: hypothetical protein ACI4V5_02970 [Prevotella sp.]
MWLVLRTGPSKEQQAKDFILAKHKEVKDVYLPLCRLSHADEESNVKYRFRPAISGIIFINIAVTEDQITQSLPLFNNLFSHRGTLKYKENVYDSKTGTTEEKTLYSNIRLLCHNTENISFADMLRQAIVPDEDMQRFIFYNERIANTIEGFTILDKHYADLVRDKDIVRIVTGPMKGWRGIVHQMKTNGRKDRKFIIRFGNSLCLCIPDIRRYDMVVEREASQGEQAKTIGAWRAIDILTAHFQKHGHPDDAPLMVRKLIKDYTITRNHSLLSSLDTVVRISLATLSDYFLSDKSGMDKALNELIPDTPIRPFLTPTSGVDIPIGQDSVSLAHRNFTELIKRVNLRSHFRTDEYEKDKYNPVDDDDYEYFAHIALFTQRTANADGSTTETYKAVAPWNGFYDHYALLDSAAHTSFLESLKTKRYKHMYSLLCNEEFKFEKTGNIGGFTMTITKTDNLTESLDRFISIVSSAAVELWQGTRLLMWRQLLQRHVLLHKTPVSDAPTVITHNSDIDKCFIPPTGEATMQTIAANLETYATEVGRLVDGGSVYSALTLFLQIAQAASEHFVTDDHYNYITSGNPVDALCTQVFETLKPHLRGNVQQYALKGMKELQANDSWRYFKHPTCLGYTKQ